MREKKCKKITFSVAMATFNAERYVEDQLNSISAQTKLPDELVIFDDCSTDGTFSICESFARNAPFPVILHQNTRNLGFGDNFLACAESCTSSWILFCDQDDVWRPNKVQRIFQEIDSASDDLLLVYHSANVVTEDLSPLNYLIPKISNDKFCPAGSKPPFWFVGGCVMCFSSKLINEFSAQGRPIDNYSTNARQVTKMPHDKWICYLANASGGILEISEPLMMYRRHANATSAYTKKVSISQRVRAVFLVDKDAAENMRLFCQRFSGLLSQYRSHSDVSEAVTSSSYLYRELGNLFYFRDRIYNEKTFISRITAYINLYLLNIPKIFRTKFFNTRHAIKDLVVALRIIE